MNGEVRLGSLFALIGLTVVTAPACGASGRAQLEKSAQVLMQQWGIKYEIVDERLESHETDLGGSWCVSLFGDRVEMAGMLSAAGFQEAIGSDGPYYQGLMKETFKPTDDLSTYRVFRAELPLGEGTICESLACTIEVVFSDRDKRAYVSISKI